MDDNERKHRSHKTILFDRETLQQNNVVHPKQHRSNKITNNSNIAQIKIQNKKEQTRKSLFLFFVEILLKTAPRGGVLQAQTTKFTPIKLLQLALQLATRQLFRHFSF